MTRRIDGQLSARTSSAIEDWQVYPGSRPRHRYPGRVRFRRINAGRLPSPREHSAMGRRRTAGSCPPCPGGGPASARHPDRGRSGFDSSGRRRDGAAHLPPRPSRFHDEGRALSARSNCGAWSSKAAGLRRFRRRRRAYLHLACAARAIASCSSSSQSPCQ